MWMDLARGYGWVKSKLGLRPNGAKNGKVRTGLSSFRGSVQQPVRPERVKLNRPTVKAKPKTKITPVSSTKPSLRKGKAGAYKPLDLANIKPPPGVRPIRRVPTRVRTR